MLGVAMPGCPSHVPRLLHARAHLISTPIRASFRTRRRGYPEGQGTCNGTALRRIVGSRRNTGHALHVGFHLLGDGKRGGIFDQLIGLRPNGLPLPRDRGVTLRLAKTSRSWKYDTVTYDSDPVRLRRTSRSVGADSRRRRHGVFDTLVPAFLAPDHTIVEGIHS